MSAELYQAINGNNAYVVKKFDWEFECLATYELSNGQCNCPRGETGKPCRHQKMLSVFINSGHIGDGYFLNYATKQWIPPVADFDPENPIAGEVISETGVAGTSPVSAREPVPAARGPEQAKPVASPAPSQGSSSAVEQRTLAPQVAGSKPASPAKSWRRV